jgi:hypothetical protein
MLSSAYEITMFGITGRPLILLNLFTLFSRNNGSAILHPISRVSKISRTDKTLSIRPVPFDILGHHLYHFFGPVRRAIICGNLVSLFWK